jgi:hypothetical protein
MKGCGGRGDSGLTIMEKDRLRGLIEGELKRYKDMVERRY